MTAVSWIRIVVASIVALTLVAVAASTRAQSRGVFVNGVALEDRDDRALLSAGCTRSCQDSEEL